MVIVPYMSGFRAKAVLLYHSKIQVLHRETEDVAIAELKVWRVSVTEHYSEGRKFSMFLVWKESGNLILGFDNHRPKGPHLHKGKDEVPYDYRGDEELINDFWKLVKQEGFLV